MKRRILTSLFVLIMLILGSVFHIYWTWNKARSIPTPVRIEITKGMSLNEITQVLIDKKILPNSFYFKAYMKYEKLTPKLTAGLFFFRDELSIKQVAQILTSGKQGNLHITIPEGRNRWEIFKILHSKMPWLNEDVWNQVSEDSIWLKEMKIPGKSIEGFLFPATYDFPQGVDEKTIQEIMIRQFRKYWATLDTINSPTIQKYGFYQVLSMASIVEEEAAKAEERSEIAGVFFGRVEQGIPLGADPTVRYIYKNMDGPILKSQLNSDSPYNTRRFRGIPPGPISNPGLEAIKASLNPNKTQMLYFVAKDDGTRAHYFAKTYPQHLKYCELASRNRQKAGRSAEAEY